MIRCCVELSVIDAVARRIQYIVGLIYWEVIEIDVFAWSWFLIGDIFFSGGRFFVVWGSCKYLLKDKLNYFYVFDIYSGGGGGCLGGREGWKYIGRVTLMCLQGVDFLLAI